MTLRTSELSPTYRVADYPVSDASGVWLKKWRRLLYAYSLSLLYKLDLNDHIVQYMYDAVLHKHVLQTSVAEGVQIIHSSQRHRRQDVQTIILTYPGVNRAMNQVHSGQCQTMCVSDFVNVAYLRLVHLLLQRRRNFVANQTQTRL